MTEPQVEPEFVVDRLLATHQVGNIVWNACRVLPCLIYNCADCMAPKDDQVVFFRNGDMRKVVCLSCYGKATREVLPEAMKVEMKVEIVQEVRRDSLEAGVVR